MPQYEDAQLDSVLTLVANPKRADLRLKDMAYVADALANAGAELGEPVWLADGIACDLPFTGIPHGVARQCVRMHRFDSAVQDAEGRRKHLLVADMDSTMITGETIDEIAAKAGIGKEIAEITARAMNGELNFEEALRERVGRLKGLDAAVLEEVRQALAFTPGGRCLVMTMRAHGAYTVLVSGGFTFATAHVRETVGFDEDRANFLHISEGKLAGTVAEPILGKEAKLATLVELREKFGLAAEDTLAVGDGANDLAMIEAAGMGVAFHAKPVVAEKARFRVNHGDLTALLYFQGFRMSEFAQ